MMLRVARCSTCSAAGVWCRTGDDIEGSQLLHLFSWGVVQNW